MNKMVFIHSSVKQSSGQLAYNDLRLLNNILREQKICNMCVICLKSVALYDFKVPCQRPLFCKNCFAPSTGVKKNIG